MACNSNCTNNSSARSISMFSRVKHLVPNLLPESSVQYLIIFCPISSQRHKITQFLHNSFPINSKATLPQKNSNRQVACAEFSNPIFQNLCRNGRWEKTYQRFNKTVSVGLGAYILSCFYFNERLGDWLEIIICYYSFARNLNIIFIIIY